MKAKKKEGQQGFSNGIRRKDFLSQGLRQTLWSSNIALDAPHGMPRMGCPAYREGNFVVKSGKL